MPSNGSVRRYAQAIFAIAQGDKTSDTWLNDLGRLTEICSIIEVQEFLKSPKLSFEQKDAFLAQHLEGLNPLALNLANLLVSKGRISLAGQIYESFQEMVDDEDGTVSAVLTSAIPLKKDLYNEIEKSLTRQTGAKLRMSSVVDPSIIGGIVARIGDKVIDGSTKAKLQNLRGWLNG